MFFGRYAAREVSRVNQDDRTTFSGARYERRGYERRGRGAARRAPPGAALFDQPAVRYLSGGNGWAGVRLEMHRAQHLRGRDRRLAALGCAGRDHASDRAVGIAARAGAVGARGLHQAPRVRVDVRMRIADPVGAKTVGRVGATAAGAISAIFVTSEIIRFNSLFCLKCNPWFTTISLTAGC